LIKIPVKNPFTIRFIFYIIFFHFSSYCLAQAGNWVWANGAGGTLNDVCNSITTDAAGNVYVTGYYKSDTMNFGNIAVLNDSSPLADIFISKYDGSGNLLWAKRTGGTGHDVATSIGCDANGNIYLTGTFSSSLISFGTVTLTNTFTGSFDIFIAKYDSSGNALWAKSIGGINDDVANNIFVGRHANLYLTGYFQSDSIVFGNTILKNAGANNSDIFIVKMDSSGNMLWAKSAGGTNDDIGNSICADKNFNVYITGQFLSYTVSFGTTTLTNASMNSDDIFIAKYDSSGNMIWAKNAGGVNDDVGNGICTDAQGNIYVSGAFFSPSVAFDAINLNSFGGGDVFVVKYDSSGNALWAKNGGGTDNDASTSIASDSGGNVYLTGYFTSSSFTIGPFTSHNLGAIGDDFFVSKLDSGGNVLWSINAGGSIDDYGLSINCDVNSNIYVAGAYYSSSINFGNVSIIKPLPDNGSADIWLGKLDRNTGIIEENTSSPGFLLFPNPASSQITIRFHEPGKAAIEAIEIYNALGEKIKNFTPSHNQLTKDERVLIDVSDLAQGIYLIRVHETNGEHIEKFMKE